jgi:hypothetical protein
VAGEVIGRACRLQPVGADEPDIAVGVDLAEEAELLDQRIGVGERQQVGVVEGILMGVRVPLGLEIV